MNLFVKLQVINVADIFFFRKIVEFEDLLNVSYLILSCIEFGIPFVNFQCIKYKPGLQESKALLKKYVVILDTAVFPYRVKVKPLKIPSTLIRTGDRFQ